ncbi:MAG TPA: acyl-CoA dehydrogenase family protein [Pseudonocardiaceae bacterium]|jgi:alkylation response protein AidB-like acyl-CoA dehydrogenase|nr:acyl-CoA dehydrogenase family protein [Pseudonocardiaceae bacterium]
MTDLLQKAIKIADEVLLPAADEVDRTGRIPEGHFHRLAEDGFYGLVAPTELGGQGVEFPHFLQIIETLAGACLTTAFTWLQHHGVVMGLVMTPNTALREKYLSRAVSGELRGGGAFSGVIPSPPRLTARRHGEGWLLNGDVMFVSGWGIVDVLHVSAIDEDSGEVVNGLIEARLGTGIAEAQPLDLVAAQASRTVRLVFADLSLPDEMVTTRANRDEFLNGLAIGLRVDSSLALGLIQRALVGMDAAGQQDVAEKFRVEAAALRRRFDAALGDPASLPALRAACSELALRVCGALVVAVGGRALLRDCDAQRLAREALFTLVFASRPKVKSSLLDLLGRTE